ncbi:MAG TPA: PIN domain-containing protein [Rhizomicrobium sp.]
MSATDFFDSNILLYLVSNQTTKAAQAAPLLAGGGTISVQVLDEFASVALRKIGRPMSDVRRALAGIRAVCTVVVADMATHELGLDIAERYKFSIYDSMLLAAAQKANCTTFFTEDLHHGQKIGGLTVRNPFRP